jgi:hypothetical protein
MSGHFLLVQTFLNQDLFEFLKKIVLIKFWWNNEKLKFRSKNPAIFQKKNSQKSGKSSGFLKYKYFFVILNTQNCILRQKLFPCVGFWDIES